MDSPKQTQKLYYQNPYQKSLTTRVIKSIPVDNHVGIILETTIFYPEGGGQPGDRGTIEGHPVLNTVISQNQIIHIMDHPYDEGTEVQIELDWSRRFDFMQAHTAQHLISAILLKHEEIPTISIHFSDNTTSIDLQKRDIPWNLLENLEILVNDMIMQNFPVTIRWYLNVEDMKDLALRKIPKKKAKEGYRIVSIEGIDASPCGGTHVNHLGEIGLIKFLKSTNITDGSRVEFVCGKRALRDYQQRVKQINQAVVLLQSPPEEIYENLVRIEQERKNLLDFTKSLQNQITTFQKEQLLEKGIQIKNSWLFSHVFENSSMESLREITNTILSKKPNAITLFGNWENSGRIQLLFARDEDHYQQSLKMGDFVKETASLCHGNGGGRPNFAQGGGKLPKKEDLDEIMELMTEKIKKFLTK